MTRVRRRKLVDGSRRRRTRNEARRMRYQQQHQEQQHQEQQHQEHEQQQIDQQDDMDLSHPNNNDSNASQPELSHTDNHAASLDKPASPAANPVQNQNQIMEHTFDEPHPGTSQEPQPQSAHPVPFQQHHSNHISQPNTPRRRRSNSSIIDGRQKQRQHRLARHQAQQQLKEEQQNTLEPDLDNVENEPPDQQGNNYQELEPMIQEGQLIVHLQQANGNEVHEHPDPIEDDQQPDIPPNTAHNIARFIGRQCPPPVAVYSMGKMDIVCQFCQALHFKGELRNCCHNGKVALPQLSPYPADMNTLLTGNSAQSRNFMDNIRNYNSGIAFASFGGNILPQRRGGPYCFRVHGQMYHQVGTLHPPDNVPPSYSQLYILEGDQAVEHRLTHTDNQNCRRDTMILLTTILQRVNPYAAAYKHMHEVEQTQLQAAQENGTPHNVPQTWQ
jgi:hypothetical protein